MDKEQKSPTSFTGAKTGEALTIIPSYRDELGRFVKGNEGISKRYKEPEKLMDDVIKYLESCRDAEKNPTMTGLALSLGFRSRRSLVNYQTEEGYEKFFHVISYAKMKIEEYLEERLLDPKNFNIAGLLFSLKNNFDWQDKQDIRIDQRRPTISGFELIMPGEDGDNKA